MNAATATNAFLRSRIIVSKMIMKRKMLQHNFCECRKTNWLSSKNILNVTATYYQCLDLIAQNTTSTWSNLICYLVSSMRGIWNLLWLKKPTNLCLLNSVMFCFLILWTFSVEQQALTRFLKLTKQQKLKASLRMNGSSVKKRWISEFPPYDAFFSKLRNVNPLEKDYSDYQKMLSCGLKTEEALSKMKLSKPQPSGEENYQYLLDIWNHEIMCTFKDFLRWHNNKDVVPTLKAMQKMVVFYHKKGNDLLKLGCTLPNIRLHKSTSANF